MVGYLDLDFAGCRDTGCTDTRKSTSNTFSFLLDMPYLGKVRSKQNCFVYYRGRIHWLLWSYITGTMVREFYYTPKNH